MKNSVFTTFFTKALLVVPALMLGSCIAETMENCPPRLFVKTKYELRNEAATRVVSTVTPLREWYEEIDNVMVYIFDENYHFVKLWEGGAYTMGEVYEVPLDTFNLKEGIYNFVVWTNCGDEYDRNIDNLTPEVTIDDLVMSLSVPADRTFREDLIHRHFGLYSEQIYYSPKSQRESHTIEIVPTTHKVNFSVIGLQGDDEYEMIVTDRNADHTFRNEYIPGEDYRHIRTMVPVAAPGDAPQGASNIAASMILLQLHDDSSTTFDLRNTTTGEFVGIPDLPQLSHIPDYANNDLMGFITKIAALKGARANFDDTREFDIVLDFSSQFIITIRVNDWVYVLNNSELS